MKSTKLILTSLIACVSIATAAAHPIVELPRNGHTQIVAYVPSQATVTMRDLPTTRFRVAADFGEAMALPLPTLTHVLVGDCQQVRFSLDVLQTSIRFSQYEGYRQPAGGTRAVVCESSSSLRLICMPLRSVFNPPLAPLVTSYSANSPSLADGAVATARWTIESL